jgi:AraC-like DNA-binding protein
VVSVQDVEDQPLRLVPDAKPRTADHAAFTYYARLGRLRAHVLHDLAEPVTAREAARIAGVSATYFSTFFHERVGVPFTRWVRAVRIERAMELIRATNVSITDVATHVGFQDLRTFERAFKSTTALTPREYKKRVRPRMTSENAPIRK